MIERPRCFHALLIHTRVYCMCALTCTQVDVPLQSALVMNKFSDSALPDLIHIKDILLKLHVITTRVRDAC